MSDTESASAPTAQKSVVDDFELVSLVWLREDFESASILDFTEALIAKNTARGVVLHRNEVEHEWTSNVFRVYGRSDSRRSFLSEQGVTRSIALFSRTSGPSAARTGSQDSKTEEDHTVFQKSRNQQEDHPFGIVMEDDKGELLIPDILLLPLHRLRLREFIMNVTIFNIDVTIGIRRMKALWSSVVMGTYIHEYKCFRLQERDKSKKLQTAEYESMVGLAVKAAEEAKAAAKDDEVTIDDGEAAAEDREAAVKKEEEGPEEIASARNNGTTTNDRPTVEDVVIEQRPSRTKQAMVQYTNSFTPINRI